VKEDGANIQKDVFKTSPDVKGRRVWTNVLPLVDTNGSAKKLTLFLHGLALLQVAKDQVLSFLTSVC
jgi:hypothetical protein